MKPYAGGGWKNVYRLKKRRRTPRTSTEVMLLQEEIVFTEYFRG
jgi:hypothetical protein